MLAEAPREGGGPIIHRYVRNGFRALQVLGVIIALWFAASMFGALAQAELFAVEDPLPAAFMAHASQAETPEAASLRLRDRFALRTVAQEIHRSNPFCPKCTDAPPPVEGQNVPEYATWHDGTVVGRLLQPGEPRTELELLLVATMQAENPRNSLATIAFGDDGPVGVFSPGDPIAENVELYAVDTGLVHLDHGGGLEYLPLPPPDAPRTKRRKASPSKTKKNKKPRKRQKHEIEGADEAIECEKNSCTIERRFVDKLIGNPSLLTKQARVIPRRRNGEMQGFKVYGIRRGSLPHLLQLKNGDMLTMVNGRPLDSMDSAMRLYQEFRHASNLDVRVERRGKEIRMLYEIR